MNDFQSMDPRKQELLEARFLGTKNLSHNSSSMINPTSELSTSPNSIILPASSYSQPYSNNTVTTDSNQSAASTESSIGKDLNSTLVSDNDKDKQFLTERKRKRRVDKSHEENKKISVQQVEINARKINDYFKHQNSPKQHINKSNTQNIVSPQPLYPVPNSGYLFQAVHQDSPLTAPLNNFNHHLNDEQSDYITNNRTSANNINMSSSTTTGQINQNYKSSVTALNIPNSADGIVSTVRNHYHHNRKETASLNQKSNAALNKGGNMTLPSVISSNSGSSQTPKNSNSSSSLSSITNANSNLNNNYSVNNINQNGPLNLTNLSHTTVVTKAMANFNLQNMVVDSKIQQPVSSKSTSSKSNNSNGSKLPTSIHTLTSCNNKNISHNINNNNNTQLDNNIALISPNSISTILPTTLQTSPINLVMKTVQTDLTIESLRQIETHRTTEMLQKNSIIEELKKTNNELAQYNTELAKTNQTLKEQIERQKDILNKCTMMKKKLLIEKSTLEKKESRQRCMQNRFRLGQFVTQRQGVNFVENWAEGYAFTDLMRRTNEIAVEKEDLERQKKALTKKKALIEGGHTSHHHSRNASYSAQNSLNQSKSSQNLAQMSPSNQPTSHLLMDENANVNNYSINLSGASANNVSPLMGSVATDSSGIMPDYYMMNSSPYGQTESNSVPPIPPPNHNANHKHLTAMDYHIQEEILKLRQLQLKKEENDLLLDYEKLERERNLHVRELKRIDHEDQSRFKDNVILNERYLLLNLLGKGGFSEVHKGYDLVEQRYVACKIHQLNKDWKDDKKANYIKHAVREYNIHKGLNHDKIIKLFDVFEIDNNSFCTVLEYCDGNDLDFYLKQHKSISEREARNVVLQAVSAIKYLNDIRPPIIHYDLKPGNILLQSGSVSGEIKITDFGLSKIMTNEGPDTSLEMDLTSQGAGTYWYLPPECFEIGKIPPKISSKVDVWSVGVIFYQCLYGKKPFGHNQSQATILQEKTILKAKEVEFPNKPLVSAEAKAFIRKCLQYRKEDRANIFDLANDDYLKPKERKGASSTTINTGVTANLPNNNNSNTNNNNNNNMANNSSQ